MNETLYDLRDLAGHLTTAFPQIQALYLFGSRRYRTGSPRSDVDILVELADRTHIRAQELRSFSNDRCPALDLFVAEGGKAVSCANESCVRANSLPELVDRLEAICFWTRSNGPMDVDIDWQFRVHPLAEYPPTAMMSGEPIPGTWPRPFRAYARQIEAAGLPVQPYVGSTVNEVAEFLMKTLQKAVVASGNLSPRGKAWEGHLTTEYDFQNLFFLVFKPWLPGLGREEVTIHYDGQAKTADFNLFSNKIIFELKHISDAGTKAGVGKTLSGLGSFYAQHPNVQILIFAVLVAKGVELDEAKWESDFSFTQREPQVWTRIFRNQ
jgi:REase_DpnII-MboI